jgi:arylsulfatase A-like enzyme
MRLNVRFIRLGLLAVTAFLVGCDHSASHAPSSAAANPSAPNVLLVIWDTVRADHLGCYGYNSNTTPQLDDWARGARIFENAVSPGSTTLPAHASMFTGLLTYEHGANNAYDWLADEHVTLAEIFKQAGYQTYAWSANAYIGAECNFAQGFDTVEHPWSSTNQAEALRIVKEKLVGDQSSELGSRLESGQPARQNIKAAGALAVKNLDSWLAARDAKRPFFAFVNWMEAHRQLIPPQKFRQRFMTPEQVAASYRVDRAWTRMWAYTFGLAEYDATELELTRLTYDSALAELDEMFAQLLAALRTRGGLDNTIVIVTSDHGEHLGDHHMMDHQYSVYDALLRVPLIVSFPGKLQPGRETRPVMTQDIFASLVEWTGVKARVPAHSLSLARPQERRGRLSGYPEAFESALRDVANWQKRVNPGKPFDFKPWQQPLRAWYSDDGVHKLIWRGRHPALLFDVRNDPAESTDLAASKADVAARLDKEMREFVAGLKVFRPSAPRPGKSADHLKRLRDNGYVGEGSEEAASDAASQPQSRPSP